jgi:PTH1 family peptidyl-tRNA hydrolase
VKRRIILGLGNPGEEYAGTRHNIAWRVLDALASRIGARFRVEKGIHAETTEGRLKNAVLVLVKPLTFMNRSGQVIPALRRLQEDLEKSLLVVCDDVNLPLGRIRIRSSGSSGGHNGLQSLIDSLPGEGFHRLRIGVDRAPGSRMKDHVLSQFEPDEEERLPAVVTRSTDAVAAWALSGITRCMNEFNRDPEEKEKE